MPQTDPRVDDYIANSNDLAKPILIHIRELVHSACPDVTETIKWGFPHFDYKGMMCSVAAFKAHCGLNFWKHSLLTESLGDREKTAMGQFGQIRSIKDLPSDSVMKKLIREAMRLNDENIKPARKKAAPRGDTPVPVSLAAALDRDPKAAEMFNSFPPGARREYIDWIAEAKTDATRDKRVATTIEWVSAGKRRNWKYEK